MCNLKEINYFYKLCKYKYRDNGIWRNVDTKIPELFFQNINLEQEQIT